jgi:Ca2+-binding EF-hand superfamily protein
MLNHPFLNSDAHCTALILTPHHYPLQTFNKFDGVGEERTGYISLTDMGNVLRSVGQNPVEARLCELQRIAKECDADNNDKLDFDEFLNFMAKTHRTEIMESFLKFDADKNGYIDREELLTALGVDGGDPEGDKLIDDMIDEADTDKDGKINYEEFCKIMKES